jgi:DNA-binding GntR family transcriptional regulator
MSNIRPLDAEVEPVKKVAQASAVDLVYKQLRIAIIRGDLRSDSKISEPELARVYDVSRGTIREAIGRLESAHLVTRKANVGARITSLSARELLDIFLVRESLEGMACRLAAENMSDADINALEVIVAEEFKAGEIIDDVILKQDHDGDKDFHLRIVYGCGNNTLIQMLCDELYPQISMYRYQFAIGSSRVQTGFNEHMSILNAIKERDGELAEILMRRHIRASRLNIEKRLQSREEAG